MWIKINNDDGGTWALEGTPDPQQIVSVEELTAQIAELELQIAEVEKEPDEILVANEEKENTLNILSNEKIEKEETLNKLG